MIDGPAGHTLLTTAERLAVTGGIARGLTAIEKFEANTRALHRRRAAADADIAAGPRLYAVEKVRGYESDSELRRLAQWRAEWCSRQLGEAPAGMSTRAAVEWLAALVEGLQARPFAPFGDAPLSDQLRGFQARAVCSLWWRRQLRRAAVRARETLGNATGEVCAALRCSYVTHDTAARHAERRASNAAMLAAAELESEAGQVMTLAELAESSVSCKAVRRGELMTRIAGCERLAESQGLRGVFLTLTAPSRFHRVHRAGGWNASYDGSTPRDAHAWLCAVWARVRSKLKRSGVDVAGFRVAEPHHDGCPHWHALLWVRPGHLWRLVRIIKRWWLKDAGDEPGARRHRVKAVLMRPGGAAGYMAKYIAKNIDDAGAVAAEGHTDDGGAGSEKPAKVDGTAQRVEAWASAWGIRQFQAIGQPPVTVWRELRRVKAECQAGATQRMALAFEAVNREGERRADWAAYVLAQGGLWRGHAAALRVVTETRLRFGRYESREAPFPIGVMDTTGPGDVHLSGRQQWRPRGGWADERPAPVPPSNPFPYFGPDMRPSPEHAAWEAARGAVLSPLGPVSITVRKGAPAGPRSSSGPGGSKVKPCPERPPNYSRSCKPSRPKPRTQRPSWRVT